MRAAESRFLFGLRSKPILSEAGQFGTPRRGTATGIGKNTDSSYLVRPFQPPFEPKPLPSFSPEHTLYRPINQLRPTYPFGWKTRRTMSTTSSLSAYLLEQKASFLADGGNDWTMVMGNEAGDLDTLASSVGFAWLLSQGSASDTRAIAFIPTLRKDFPLRAENLYALQSVGIKENFDELLCSGDLPKVNLCTSYALVDQNNLPPIYAVQGARVTSIVDHHEDEGKYRDTASPRIIESAGSCASLVTRVIMSYPTLQIPSELALLLLSAIVIDTHGLRKGGKAVDVDYQATAWLLPRAQMPSSDCITAQTVETALSIPNHPWIRSLSDTLSAKKAAISHLTTRDLLRRDYKEYHVNLSTLVCGDTSLSIKVGLATVPLPLSSIFSPSPASTVVATQEWMKERDLSILGVLTHYKSKHGKPKRELMWVVDQNVSGPKLPQALFEGFEGSEVLQVKRIKFKRCGFDDHLGRDTDEKDEVRQAHSDQEDSVDEQAGTPEGSESPFGAGLVARVYRQKNATATRKQVAPILRQILEG